MKIKPSAEMDSLITDVKLDCFGPITNLHWPEPGKINLIIGGNACGKTFLLKALYVMMRTIEEFQRGDERRTLAELLADKLYWTFQVERIGELVSRGKEKRLEFSAKLGHDEFKYGFGKDTKGSISNVAYTGSKREANTVFLPAKEVLTLHRIILKSREQDKLFGFDDTYLDLARALQSPPQKGKNYAAFAEARDTLESIVGGKVDYDDASGRWLYTRGSTTFPIGTTSEGVKKIAILDTLLGNRYLTPKSVVFIDEPESALHPAALAKFLNIVEKLSETGMQFFIASHSYYVVKGLQLIAQKNKISIPVASFGAEGAVTFADVKDGLPKNGIIDEAIELHRQEVELALQ